MRVRACTKCDFCTTSATTAARHVRRKRCEGAAIEFVTIVFPGTDDEERIRRVLDVPGMAEYLFRMCSPYAVYRRVHFFYMFLYGAWAPENLRIARDASKTSARLAASEVCLLIERVCAAIHPENEPLRGIAEGLRLFVTMSEGCVNLQDAILVSDEFQRRRATLRGIATAASLVVDTIFKCSLAAPPSLPRPANAPPEPPRRICRVFVCRACGYYTTASDRARRHERQPKCAGTLLKNIEATVVVQKV